MSGPSYFRFSVFSRQSSLTGDAPTEPASPNPPPTCLTKPSPFSIYCRNHCMFHMLDGGGVASGPYRTSAVCCIFAEVAGESLACEIWFPSAVPRLFCLSVVVNVRVLDWRFHDPSHTPQPERSDWPFLVSLSAAPPASRPAPCRNARTHVVVPEKHSFLYGTTSTHAHKHMATADVFCRSVGEGRRC